MKTPKILDTECYKDYWLLSLKCASTGKVREFELYDGQPLNRQAISNIMKKHLTVSFNGLAYDLPMIAAALKGWSNENLKKLSDKLILSGKPAWLVCKELKLWIPKDWDHIDLINVASGQASLKIYGGRLHSKKLQDLPIEPDQSITPDLRPLMRSYCINDLDTTIDLFNALEKQIALRVTLTEKYGVDLRSKSDAQMAETIIKNYLNQQGVDVVKRQTAVKPFKYRVPNWVKFKTDTFNDVLETVKGVTFVAGDSGQVKLPKELNKAINFYDAKYQIGIGGLHSQEKRQVIKPKSDEIFGEYDLTSMYPTIIIEQNLYPEHLTSKFLDTYIQIKNSRVEAKEEISKLKKELRLLKSEN